MYLCDRKQNTSTMNSQEAAEKLGHKGIKATANRIIIYQALESARHPMSLADLEEKLLTMDKSSIFRVLNLFVKHDVVHAFEDGRGIQHYELCDHEDECLHTDTHPHFYCEQCHRSFCLDDTTLPHISLPDGYIPHFYSFVIKGLCADCSRKLPLDA